MRDYIIFTIAAFGVLWAFDAYEFDGRYSQVVWKQTGEEVRTVRTSILRAVDKAMAGKCGFCD